MVHGSNQYETKVEVPNDTSISLKQAAELVGVSRISVARAKKRMHENPEAHAAAKAGKTKAPKSSGAEPPANDCEARRVKSERSIATQRALAEIDRRKAAGESISAGEIFKATGISAPVIRKAIAIREVEAAVTLPELSATAQQKLDVYRKRLEAEFDQRVREASAKWLEEVRLPIYEKQIEELKEMLSWPRNAVMTKSEYNTIIRCLHPDGLRSRTEAQLAEAFRIFTRYKPKMVADEETRRSTLADFPRTREELLARKAAR
jgi:transposase